MIVMSCVWGVSAIEAQCGDDLLRRTVIGNDWAVSRSSKCMSTYWLSLLTLKYQHSLTYGQWYVFKRHQG